MIIDYEHMTDEELATALNYIQGEIAHRRQAYSKELWDKVVKAVHEYVTFAEPIFIETWGNTYTLDDAKHRLRSQGVINLEN